MKPKEVTDLLGIDRERIKTLKREGVFTPEIKTKRISNYTEGDVEQLRKLTVLNKAGLTCSDIRKMQNGEWSMSQAIEECTRLIKEKIEQYMGSLLLKAFSTRPGKSIESIRFSAFLLLCVTPTHGVSLRHILLYMGKIEVKIQTS